MQYKYGKDVVTGGALTVRFCMILKYLNVLVCIFFIFIIIFYYKYAIHVRMYLKNIRREVNLYYIDIDRLSVCVKFTLKLYI